jgi:hypothetical protein
MVPSRRQASIAGKRHTQVGTPQHTDIPAGPISARHGVQFGQLGTELDPAELQTSVPVINS